MAITSSFHPDEHTHIEPCRYGKGFNTMAMMQTVLTDGDGDGPRWRAWLKEMWTQKRNLFDLYDLKHWSERTVIALVMQSLDNSITTYGKRSRLTGKWRMTSQAGPRRPQPDLDPGRQRGRAPDRRRPRRHARRQRRRAVQHAAHRPLHRRLRDRHSPETGVVDPYQRVFNYPGLHVADGSAISANLGVNPSLTITAQAERAMALWPNKGEADPRPAARRRLRADRARRRPVSPGRPVARAGRPAPADRGRLLRLRGSAGLDNFRKFRSGP